MNQVSSVIDVGTGAGFPGLVLAICFPQLKVTLVEKLRKRVDFLFLVKKELGLDNVFICSICKYDGYFIFLPLDFNGYNMLLRLIVENIASFKDAVEFNTFPSSRSQNHENHKIRCGHATALRLSAIYGANGAGKSTTFKAALGLIRTDAGKITIDGTDIRDIPRDDLRSLYGMVLQDTWLFNGTIKDNIRYGRLDATDDEVIAAAKAAHADEFISELSEGYDTILEENGENLSQGQRQLLTIARALLKDPKILILDEATSSVDTRTELLLQAAMSEIMKGRTNFVIAHRLSTIREADMILVMNEGRIVETGTHKELMKEKVNTEENA